MTVAELIEALGKLDPTLPVFVWDDMDLRSPEPKENDPKPGSARVVFL